MHAHAQVFSDNIPTPATHLTCEPRINSHQPATSIFNFVSQQRDQLTPARIVNRFREARARQTGDVQVFNGNQTVRVGKLAGEFVLKIQALIRYLAMPRGNRSRGFAPAPRKFLATREELLGFDQLHLRGPIQRGFSTICPSDWATKAFNPTSKPTAGPGWETGTASGNSSEKTTYHAVPSRLR